ncbi:MAG: hypothetical protein JO123_06105, partial [Ktedonobacteraceae bacterium]|nr:hypothetical protein [Ktedonobacteraceae bacterium]
MSQDSGKYTFMNVTPCLDEEEGTVDFVKMTEADEIAEKMLDAINYLDPSTFPTQEEIEDTLRQ